MNANGGLSGQKVLFLYWLALKARLVSYSKLILRPLVPEAMLICVTLDGNNQALLCGSEVTLSKTREDFLLGVLPSHKILTATFT